MVRAHLADPHIVNKLAAGEEDRSRPCVGASLRLNRIYVGLDALCLHNPATGREALIPHRAAGRSAQDGGWSLAGSRRVAPVAWVPAIDGWLVIGHAAAGLVMRDTATSVVPDGARPAGWMRTRSWPTRR